MIFLLAITLSLILTSFVGIAFGQEFAGIDPTHIGLGGGTLGTGTGAMSLWQSNNNRKENKEIWNKLTELETVNAVEEGSIDQLFKQMGRVEKTVEILNQNVTSMQLEFAEARGLIGLSRQQRITPNPPGQEPTL